ncbi:MAG: ATP-dependent zinc protease [Deltaproteobacteria bacterium]|nr:MAG: ATP-dependent zinc protease [Deltaproteobacteria bacterium]
MKKFLFSVSLATVALMFLEALPAEGKLLVGWLEKVRIYPGDLVIHAKLDTGAKNSSLNASHVTAFERDGEQWVRFDVTSRYGKTATIERKVRRMVKIKRHGAKPQARFAINLGICLGNSYKEVEVNLTERSDFLYQMLVGRSFLAGSFVVDSSAKYTTKPNCSLVPGQ